MGLQWRISNHHVDPLALPRRVARIVERIAAASIDGMERRFRRLAEKTIGCHFDTLKSKLSQLHRDLDREHEGIVR